jgi:hypothetical protein
MGDVDRSRARRGRHHGPRSCRCPGGAQTGAGALGNFLVLGRLAGYPDFRSCDLGASSDRAVPVRITGGPGRLIRLREQRKQELTIGAGGPYPVWRDRRRHPRRLPPCCLPAGNERPDRVVDLGGSLTRNLGRGPADGHVRDDHSTESRGTPIDGSARS